jgi:hypothetical protein
MSDCNKLYSELLISKVSGSYCYDSIADLSPPISLLFSSTVIERLYSIDDGMDNEYGEVCVE